MVSGMVIACPRLMVMGPSLALGPVPVVSHTPGVFQVPDICVINPVTMLNCAITLVVAAHPVLAKAMEVMVIVYAPIWVNVLPVVKVPSFVVPLAWLANVIVADPVVVELSGYFSV